MAPAGMEGVLPNERQVFSSRIDANGVTFGGFWRRVVAWIIDWVIVSSAVSILFLVIAAFVPDLGKSVRLAVPFDALTTEQTIDSKTTDGRAPNGATVTTTKKIVQTTVLGKWTYYYKVTSTTKDGPGSSRTTNTTRRQIDPFTGQDIKGAGLNNIILLVMIIYWILMEWSPYQASVGKLAFGMKVTDAAGNRLTLPKATARNLLKIVSALIFGIGFLMAGWTKRKQALHDKIVSCYVVFDG